MILLELFAKDNLYEQEPEKPLFSTFLGPSGSLRLVLYIYVIVQLANSVWYNPRYF